MFVLLLCLVSVAEINYMKLDAKIYVTICCTVFGVCG